MDRRRAACWAVLAAGGAPTLSGCGVFPWSSSGGAALQSSLDDRYRRGAAALARNDLEAAIAAWRDYVRLAPPRAPRTRQVRGYLTLLQREGARRAARGAAAGERSLAGRPTDRLHVALFPFGTLGTSPPGTAFNRAIVAMITADLSKVPQLTVLERERIDALVQELRLSASGLADPATAVQPARLLGAGTVIAGAVFNEPGAQGPGSGRYRISAAVTDVQAGRVRTSSEAEGRQAEFFVLQKRIVYGILQALDITELPPGVHRVHTRSWEAYARFAAGLQALAEDRYDAARAAFAQALSLDPAFLLAEDALEDTPQRAATVEEISAEVQRGGPAP